MMEASAATYTFLSPKLTVSKSGSGAVLSSPTGINCGSACSARFKTNTKITLTATPATGYVFSAWSGACKGTSPVVTDVLTGSATCTANFAAASAATAPPPPAASQYSLTLAPAGSGTGAVTSTPSGISCGSTCTVNFAANTVVTLAAVASPGSNFSGWSGNCAGTTASTSVALTANSTCNATFAASANTVTPSAGANGTISPAAVQTVALGASASFTITPAAGYTAIVGGTCGGSLTGTTYTTNAINAPCTVAATFSNGTSDSDFSSRCAAPGVVLCKGLDTEAELLAAEMGKAGDGTRQGFIDTAGKTSGAGSLKFTLRSGVGLQNLGGYWETPLGATFKVGDTIHVQYRFKASPEYFSNNQKYWRSSIKHINIHGPSSTCQGAEYTTVLEPGKQLDMYTNCGDGWFTDATTNAKLSGCTGDCLIQQGASTAASPGGSGYNCHYQNQFSGKGDGNGCFWPVADKWYTIYEKIFVGQFGGSTSTVDAYVSVDGGPYKQFHRVAGIFFNSNRDNNFSHLRFETYMTEIAAAAPVNAYVWYDELIVSRQPIAAPGN